MSLIRNQLLYVKNTRRVSLNEISKLFHPSLYLKMQGRLPSMVSAYKDELMIATHRRVAPRSVILLKLNLQLD